LPDIGRVHAEHDLAERRVHEVGDHTRRAAVVQLAPADDAIVGRHLDDDCVALHCSADAERHAALGRHREGRGIGLEFDDLHRVIFPDRSHEESTSTRRAWASQCQAVHVC